MIIQKLRSGKDSPAIPSVSKRLITAFSKLYPGETLVISEVSVNQVRTSASLFKSVTKSGGFMFDYHVRKIGRDKCMLHRTK
jgi:hypothetical protein